MSSPNLLATSINTSSTNTTTPRTTSIEEITPKTATCTEQLLALAAASHASADMAASSTLEVDDDQEESSSVKQLLPVTSPIKIANGPSTTTSNNSAEEKAPTPDKASSSNSQIMSPTTAIKITEAQTPKHCNKSPYNTSTTTTANNTNKEDKFTTATNTISGPNPIGKQLNPNLPARSKSIKQYWPIRYSNINTNERRIQAELGNYSTSYVEGDVENRLERERKLERDRMIKERDARDFGISQQRKIYEQQQQFVNAHRNMYEKQPYGYGGSPPTHYHHHNQPMPQFVPPPSRYSSGKYHYEGGYPPPHYEGYPPPHLAQGGYYGSPSNYQRQYNVAGYSAAQVAPHHAPSGYNAPTTTTGGYGSYQDKEVPLSTVPSKDGSKGSVGGDGSLHAVSSSFSNEGVGKVMKSPGVVTSNGSGSVGESTQEGVIPNQPSLSKSSESKEEDDAVSWHQTKDEMLRLTMTKSELTDVSKVTDESSGVVQTEKQAEDTGVSKKATVETSPAVQTPKNATAQQSSTNEEKKPQDVEESDLKQVPSTLSALSNSPTDEQQQQQPPSSTRSSRAATHAIHHYENNMNEMMMMGYHNPPRGNMMYPPPPSHHVPSPHHYMDIIIRNIIIHMLLRHITIHRHNSTIIIPIHHLICTLHDSKVLLIPKMITRQVHQLYPPRQV